MVAIVIGYKEPGSQSPFEILYAGRDATAADAVSLAPPPGILRTEMFKNPIVVRRRTYPENTLPETTPEDPKAAKARAKAEAKAAEEAAQAEAEAKAAAEAAAKAASLKGETPDLITDH